MSKFLSQLRQELPEGKFEVDALLDEVYESYQLVEDADHSATHELVLHADNTGHLHHSSHEPIMNNLAKHAARGKYDPDKARKLWGYHADRAAQSYHKEHGGEGKWHHAFSTATRRAAAHHWEESNRGEVHERAAAINAARAAKKKK
jgi:hypothetical protein